MRRLTDIVLGCNDTTRTCRYIHFNLDSTVGDCLQNRTVIEFPTFLVAIPSDAQLFASGGDSDTESSEESSSTEDSESSSSSDDAGSEAEDGGDDGTVTSTAGAVDVPGMDDAVEASSAPCESHNGTQCSGKSSGGSVKRARIDEQG